MSADLHLGQALRAGREKKGLSLSEVAEGTRIKVQILEEIENNDFRHVPATVYAKGFIKMYAEFVGLDPTPLIAQYVAHHASAAQRPSLATDRTARPNDAADSPSVRSAVQGAASARTFHWPRVKRELADAFLRPLELAALMLDRVRIPQRRRKTTFRNATAFREITARLPVWQYAAIAASVLVILILVVSSVSRYRHRALQAGAPHQGAPVLTLRLAEEPPPPYLPSPAP